MSMQILEGISRHPVFSSSMHTVRLSFVKAFDVTLEHSHGDDVDECKWLNRIEFKNDKVDALAYRNEAKEIDAEQSEQLETAKQLVRLQNGYIKRSADYDYLLTIFSNLKAACNIPRITAGSDRSDRCDSAIGYRKLFKSMHLPEPHRNGYRFETDVCDYRQFQVVCDAIRDAQFPVESLWLGYEDMGITVSPDGFITHSNAFAHLREFRVHLELTKEQMREYHSDQVDDYEPKDRHNHFIAFIRKATQLQTLSLMHTQERWEASSHNTCLLLEAIAREVQSSDPDRAFQCLEHLEFDSFFFWNEPFLTIIRKLRPTLKRLRVHNACDMMRSPGGWSWKESVEKAYGRPGLDLSGNLFTRPLDPSDADSEDDEGDEFDSGVSDESDEASEDDVSEDIETQASD